MKIRKIGHSCMYIQEAGLKILIDPGMFTTAQNELTGLDIMLITHEHADHCDINSIKEILKNNPKLKIFTNTSVKNILAKEGIEAIILEDGQSHAHEGVLFHAFGDQHAMFHPTLPVFQNTGYMIGNRFYYPGDSFAKPDRPVEILALPVGGPWMKTMEAIDFAFDLKPKVVFPVHDMVYANPAMTHRWPAMALEKAGIKFISLENDGEIEV